MNPHKVYVLFLLLNVLSVVVIFLAPYLMYTGHTFFSNQLYHAFSSLCHQRPERSFFMWGYPLAVCARCTFLYVGMLVGMILYPLWFGREIPLKVVLVFAAPVVVDGFSQLFFRESSNEIRALTGFLLGVVIPLYVLPKFFKSLR